MGRAKVTIISPKQARRGYRFIFDGLASPCLPCSYLNACVGNLEVGRIYEVKNVLKKTLECRLHEERGCVVEVDEIVHHANIKPQAAVQDALIRFEPIECETVDCPEYGKCNPVGLRVGDPCKVVAVGEATSCPRGVRLALVQLAREPPPSGTVQRTRRS